MMKSRCCNMLTGFIVFICGLILFPSISMTADNLNKPILILADVSGTMQDKITDQNQREKAITKVEILKELLLDISRELPSMTCETGIYEVRYLSGDKYRYEPFLKIKAYDQIEMIQEIKNEFVTDYPVFNRRTPLADMLRQLDENELEKINGAITLVLISDGRETFYNLKKDEKANQQEKINPDDKVRGPLTEIRRLKEKYGDNITLHTLFLDQKEKENEEEKENEVLLKSMASVGEGKYYYAVELLEDRELLTEFCSLLCQKEEEKIEVLEEPPKTEAEEIIVETEETPIIAKEAEIEEPEVEEPEIIEEPEGPKDTDGDGVYDPDDQCPGTPKGAKVNPMGCWVLPGVLFDFDKWNIKPQFQSELDDAIVVLNKNPDLRIIIEGHTDGKGTAAYNVKLSERRANSVMQYFIQHGIEKERLSTVGYGLTRPVATNATSEGRALNRRVELKPVR